MSGRRAKAARRAVRSVVPALAQTYEATAPKLPPAGFWRRVLWLFAPWVKARDRSAWELLRGARKEAYLKAGKKKLARIAVQGMRKGFLS